MERGREIAGVEDDEELAVRGEDGVGGEGTEVDLPAGGSYDPAGREKIPAGEGAGPDGVRLSEQRGKGEEQAKAEPA
jgi:hypothetical protein